MISLLRNNLLVSPIFLIVLLIILRIKAFIDPVSYELVGTEGPLFNLVANLSANQYIEIILTTLLIFLQAYMVNRIVMLHNLTRPPNYLSAFFYIVISSVSVNFFGFHPVLVANTFVILAITEIYKIYKYHKSAIHIFNAGFFLAIGALFYFPLFILYFACSVIILILRSYNFLERLQLFFGFLTPFYLFAIYYYLNDGFSVFWTNYVQFSVSMPSLEGITQADIYTLCIFGLGIVISIFSYRQFIIKKGIQIEKKIDSLYWLMVFGLVSIFLSPQLYAGQILILTFPLAIFFSMFVLAIKNKTIQELFGIMCLILTLFVQFVSN